MKLATVARCLPDAGNHATVKWAQTPQSKSEKRKHFRKKNQVASQFPKLHYLINNAGMIRDVTWNTFGWQTLRRMDSEDGHELVMATNYLGRVERAVVIEESGWSVQY